MVNLELTHEEGAILKRALELAVSDVRMEICDTDSADFKEGLRAEKQALERAIAQLADQLP